MNLIYNGKEINEADFKVGFDNRAFTYGDGVFETIIGSSQKVNFLSDHLERLCMGIQALGMKVPMEINLPSLEKSIITLIQKNHIEKEARIKILVWRKSGGLFTPTQNEAEFMITASVNHPAPAVKEKVLFYNDIKLSYSPISKFKTLSSLPYVMAGMTNKSLQTEDLILFDTEDHIAECLVPNIFWIKNEKLYTPSLETGCKEGIMRKQIIRFLKKNAIPWEEGKFKKEDLMNSEVVFTSNVAGIVPIRNVEEKKLSVESDMILKIRKYLITL